MGRSDESPPTPLRVLIADDEAGFRDTLRPLIDGRPDLSVVAEARNGLDAIQLADAFLPDAVVIDLHMPLLDGVTAVARIRKDHPSLCLIALTGDSATDLHHAASEAGADAVLLKDDLVGSLVERLAGVKHPQDAGGAGLH